MLDFDVIDRGERVHFPATLPRLLDHGSPVDPTQGDVDAIFRGCVRLMRGETIESTTPRGERVLVSMLADGRVTLKVGESTRTFTNAHDALVHAYGLISSFNEAWFAFEGGL